MRMVRGTKYRKVQDRGGGKRYSRRVHLVFWCKDSRYRLKHWRYVCGKPQPDSLDYILDADEVEDETPVTCRGCIKFAPEVVEKMETIPNIMDLQ